MRWASADVAKVGYTGMKLSLTPVRSGDHVIQEARATLETRTPYRILVHATPAGGGPALEAQFDYRHHH